MKLRDVMKLPELSGFRLISGDAGLDKEVFSTEIIDFEFASGIDFSREEMFYGSSLGLSSLMFAKDEPELLLDAVKQLDNMGVACLCYKPIFFKELPQEVLEYSEKNNFPVYEITDDAFFEDIVLAVRKEAGMDLTETEVEDYLDQIIRKELEQKDKDRLIKRIGPGIRPFVQAVFFETENTFAREEMRKYSRRLSLDPRYGERTALVRFAGGGLILLSREDRAGNDMDALLKDAIITAGIPMTKPHMGMGRVYPLDTGFGRTVREAYWALQAAKVEDRELKKYGDIGVYRLLAPAMSNEALLRSAEDFLGPVLLDDEDMETLFGTAREFVMCGGDIKKTAENLFCHKNTVRYRLKRIKLLTAPALDDKDFTESLILAMRIVLLKGYGSSR